MCNWRYVGVSFLLAILPTIATFAEPEPQPKETKVFPGKVIYLEETADWKIPLKSEGQPPDAFVQKLLLRQFCRQALLLAAREELGLATRDAALGDLMPTGKADGLLLMGANSEKPSGVYVQRPGDETQQVNEFIFDGDYLNAAISAEEMSRKWCVEVLKKLGFSGEANKQNSDAKVPEQVEPLLAQMTFTSQFQAVRLLHGAIRRDGESDELLGALVRGYANLGWLTEHHWLAGPDVFKARAILYAQRMVARGDHPAWAKWHRAYALAAIGLHAKALADLKSGDGSLSDGSSGDDSEASLEGRRPAWANLIEAHCLFKLDDLDPDKTDEPHQQLAELLRIINLELSNGERNRIYHVDATIAAAQAMPECYRVLESLSSRSGVGLGHGTTVLGLQMLGQKLYSRLAAMPNLPIEAQKIVTPRAVAGGKLGRLLGMQDISPTEEFVVRGQLIDALMGVPDTDPKESANTPTASKQGSGSARESDRGEPSWATLGYLIREASFVQVWRRARFERFSLCASADDFLDMAAPLIARHPCRVFIEAHTTDLSEKQKLLQRLDELPVWNMDLTARKVQQSFATRSKQECPKIAEQLLANCDMVARDLSMIMPWISKTESKKEYAHKLHKISPFCPYARAYLIKFDWETIAASADQWGKDALGNSAYVLACLGERYFNLKKYDDAERFFQTAIEMSPDKDSHQALAEIYKRQGKMDKWLEILEEFLDQPSYGLEHARIRVQIAHHYIANDDWERAQAYAEKAAECYSAWSLQLAGECHERLAHWDEAERYFEAVARRYHGSNLMWYNFCRRTGQGNLKEATEWAQSYVNEIAEFNKTHAFGKLGTYYALHGSHKKALDYFKRYFDERWRTYEGLHAALVADELGDVVMRDEIFKEIDYRSKWLKNNGRYYDYEVFMLAKLMADDLARGGKADFPPVDFDNIIKNSSEQQRMNCYYFLAKYLQLRGNEDRAIHYWKLCLATDCIYGWNRTLAGAELLKRGYKADCYMTPEAETKQPPNETDADAMKEKKAKQKKTKKTKETKETEGFASKWKLSVLIVFS